MAEVKILGFIPKKLVWFCFVSGLGERALKGSSQGSGETEASTRLPVGSPGVRSLNEKGIVYCLACIRSPVPKEVALVRIRASGPSNALVASDTHD